MTGLLLNFPEGYEPNNAQKIILTKMEKAIGENKKFIIVNAPTGSGKSLLPKTLANVVNGPSENFKKCVDNYSIFGDDGPDLMEDENFGVYALTITKALQDQYKNTFPDTGILKGQGNYQCGLDDSMTVDIAPCIYVKGLKQDCWKCNKCPYYNHRNEMLKSTFSSLNYSMFFSLPSHLRKRKVIVCDEGSELEDQLINLFTCEVDLPFLVKTNTEVSSFPMQETDQKVLAWATSLLRSVADNVENYKDLIKNEKRGIDLSKRRSEYTKLTNLQKSLETLIHTYYDAQYLIERIDKKIRFIPLKIDKLSKFIFDCAEHVVIMSATIIDPVNFCKNLGITDYEYIEVSTGFDPEKAPIYVMVKQKLNFGNLKDMLPKLATQVAGLLEEHKNEKGIIHTHTQYITDYIKDNVHSSRLLCRAPGVRNEELLDMHEQSPHATVLVSPSMTYGVDLHGDLATFQILLKAPWLPTKEIRVEKMMKLDKSWYTNKMLCTLVQACGRGIRSLDDECITYILDGSIYDTIEENKQKLPKFFIDRFQ